MTFTGQFRKKLQSHGLLLTLYFCLVYVSQVLLAPFRRRVLKSYSQAGEDILLDKLLSGKKTGFYVDIGAHDPVYLSNTKRFYDRGWSGINIEPNPELIFRFKAERPRDVNLACGAGGKEGTLNFCVMEQAALSSCDPQQVALAKRIGGRVRMTCEVEIRTLESVFSQHVHGPIDFMSIDIEGLEYEALDSNDWDRWRPKLICIEAVSDEDIRQEPVLRARDGYFAEIGYKRIAQTYNFGRVLNAIYLDERSGQAGL